MMNLEQQKALNYLNTHHVLTLATHGTGGVWSAALFYVNRDFTLYFLSAPSTRHIRNLDVNNQVAVTINENYGEWTAIKGIQLEGEVHQITAIKQIEEVKALYEKKFPFNGPEAPFEITVALSSVNWYVCNPSSMYFIDNSLGLGHRDEILLT